MIYVYRFTVGDTLDERRVWQCFAVVPSVVIVHFVAECYVGKTLLWKCFQNYQNKYQNK